MSSSSRLNNTIAEPFGFPWPCSQNRSVWTATPRRWQNSACVSLCCFRSHLIRSLVHVLALVFVTIASPRFPNSLSPISTPKSVTAGDSYDACNSLGLPILRSSSIRSSNSSTGLGGSDCPCSQYRSAWTVTPRRWQNSACVSSCCLRSRLMRSLVHIAVFLLIAIVGPFKSTDYEIFPFCYCRMSETFLSCSLLPVFAWIDGRREGRTRRRLIFEISRSNCISHRPRDGSCTRARSPAVEWDTRVPEARCWLAEALTSAE